MQAAERRHASSPTQTLFRLKGGGLKENPGDIVIRVSMKPSRTKKRITKGRRKCQGDIHPDDPNKFFYHSSKGVDKYLRADAFARMLAKKDADRRARMATDDGRLSAVRASLKCRAKREGVSFDLTLSQLKQLVNDTGDNCPVTGTPFNTPSCNQGPEFDPTFDRVFPEVGYRWYNLRRISRRANSMKGNKTTVPPSHPLYAYMSHSQLEVLFVMRHWAQSSQNPWD